MLTIAFTAEGVQHPRARCRLRVVLIAGIVALATLVGLVWTPDSGRASGCTITWVGDVNGDWFGGSAPTDTNWTVINGQSLVGGNWAGCGSVITVDE